MFIAISSASATADWIWPATLAVLGAIAGSFLATIAIRWPQDRSVMQGRSACDGCGRTLGAAELIPIVSALASRGRCLTCGSRIDPRHLGFELGCAAIGVVSGLVAPGWGGAAGALVGWLLLTLAAIDAAELWLPDPLVAALALAALAGAPWLPPAIDERLIGLAAGIGSLGAIALGYCAVRGRDGLGWGDPKLFGAIGLWLGWRMLPIVVVLACLTGFGVILFRRLTGRDVARHDALPFGTFLAIAAYPAWIAMIVSTR